MELISYVLSFSYLKRPFGVKVLRAVFGKPLAYLWLRQRPSMIPIKYRTPLTTFDICQRCVKSTLNVTLAYVNQATLIRVKSVTNFNLTRTKSLSKAISKNLFYLWHSLSKLVIHLLMRIENETKPTFCACPSPFFGEFYKRKETTTNRPLNLPSNFF